MLSKISRWKLVVGIGGVGALLVIALVTILAIDGDAHDRWRTANNLRAVWKTWTLEGSPWPPDPVKCGERFSSRSSTTYVYTASLVVDGLTNQCLAASAWSERFGTYIVCTNGVVLVQLGSRPLRQLKISKTKAAAW
jgi:hypothetical protein